MNKFELKEILNKHKQWIESNGELGERADLGDVNLRKANLRGVDLKHSDLRGADLRYSKLIGADLRGADLRGADLRKSILRGAILRGADLRGANLMGADLRGVDLTGVKSNSMTSGFHLVCPEEGSFVGFKKGEFNTIIKLLIPEGAKRSSGTSRKCRADKAIVLEIIDENGEQIEITASDYLPSFIYKLGETVEVKDFDENRWNECSIGIHFFITKKEAEEYRY